MKAKEWKKAKKRIKELWWDRGLTRCENCGSTFAMSFHHIKRRSAGGTSDPENIILLCAECHHRADNASGYVEFNKRLKKMAEAREALF